MGNKQMFNNSPRDLAAAVILALASLSPATAADVSFRAAFEAAAGQDVVSIAIPDADTLIFEGGTYYSKGRRINIVAARARSTGETRIGFYAPEIRPPTISGVASTGLAGAGGASGGCSRSGCNGAPGGLGGPGAPGTAGASAPTFVFDIGRIEGDGKVFLVAAGQGGGQGQKGGKGGTGGPGGDGAKRSCGGLAGLDTKAGPGNGGTGGAGGLGGVGGPGGQGGDAGFIGVSSTLAENIKAGMLVVDLNPAPGGPGGDPGDAGDPGGGGVMGRGNSCGGGGRGGNAGGGGTPGVQGPGGGAGKVGSMRYLATETSAPVVVAGSGTRQ